jgi:hypothetical protein
MQEECSFDQRCLFHHSIRRLKTDTLYNIMIVFSILVFDGVKASPAELLRLGEVLL